MEDWLWKKFVFNYYKFIAFTHYNIYILSKKKNHRHYKDI